MNTSLHIYLKRIYWISTLCYIHIIPGARDKGWGSLVGCRLWGRTESDTTDLAAAAGIK